jgi:uncharacterized alkaline shock family protein YloU
MDNSLITPGKTTIAIDVLLTIARLTTLSVPGVNRFSRLPSRRMKNMFKGRGHDDGVQIEVEDDTVYIDLFVILDSDVNIQEVGHSIQSSVSRSIIEMIGMQVGRINIHVDDIYYELDNGN